MAGEQTREETSTLMYPHMKSVVIVGGGWAGLAAAIELTHHGIPVSVYEASQTLGGRARSIGAGDDMVDNGQHLLLGAYSELLRLLNLIGAPEQQVLDRRSLSLSMLEPDGGTVSLRASSALPAPLHLLSGLLCAQGLSLSERFAAIHFCIHLAISGFTLKQDLSVDQWLTQHRQPLKLTRAVWEPLCLAALNTPIAYASAQVFLRILRDAFARKRSDSDLLLISKPLAQLFPIPAREYIKCRGGTIEMGARVKQLHIQSGNITGVGLTNYQTTTNHVILAIPPSACSRLITGHPDLDSLAAQLALFDHEPICTLYLQYPVNITLKRPMLGMIGTHTQWLFDHSQYGKPGFMSAVISGPGPHITMQAKDLASTVISEIAHAFPSWPAPLDNYLIRDKRATISCKVNIDQQRPNNATAVRGLWLAGDYTATGLPATLEGAVRSGVECARQVMAG